MIVFLRFTVVLWSTSRRLSSSRGDKVAASIPELAAVYFTLCSTSNTLSNCPLQVGLLVHVNVNVGQTLWIAISVSGGVLSDNGWLTI